MMHTQGLGEKGQILPATAVAMVAILALAGLALDGGMALETKRRAQTAADSAAIAGAVEVKKNPMTTEMTSSARHEAQRNGFTHGADGVVVQVHNPPTSGRYAGKSDYVETVVTQQRPSTLLQTIGITSTTSGGRAVAGPKESDMCVLVLHPTQSKALNMSGSASIIAPNCTVAVNSSDSEAIAVSGSACIDAKTIAVVGNVGGSCYTPDPDTGSAPTPDPFVNHARPSYGSTCDYTNTVISGTTPLAQRTLNPGVYCGGIRISSTPGVRFNPGTYILLGGGLVSSGSSSTLTGTGVTFYITGNSTYPFKPITVSGGGALNLSAPTSGPMEGMLFFQDRNFTTTSTNTISGGSTMNIEGVLYFPTTKLTYSGGSTNNGAYTVIVVNLLNLTGPSGIGTDFSGLSSGSPIKTGVALAE